MNAMSNPPKDPRTLKQSLDQIIEHGRKRAPKPARQPRAPKVSGFDKATQKAIEKAIARDEASVIDMVVPKEAQAHGVYQLVEHKLFETVKDGKVKTESIRVVMNKGATTVDRWLARDRLSQRQYAAILFFQAVWAKTIGEQRVTANLEPVIRGGAGDALEYWTQSQIAAKYNKLWIENEVLIPAGLDRHQIFVNVVIFDEPAGVAGSRLGYRNKQAEAVALEVVRHLSDQIAYLIMDTRRPDLDELLRHVDTPACAPHNSGFLRSVQNTGPLTLEEAEEFDSLGEINQDTRLTKRGRDLWERHLVHGRLTDKVKRK